MPHIPPPPGPALQLWADGPEGAAQTLILAHGAGQGPHAPFMQAITDRLTAHGVRVLRFAFPYMARIGVDGRRRPPDREPVLRATWQAVIDAAGVTPGRVVIGGKSMGGRIASLVADEAGVAALVCLGYPFHPPGRPAQARTAHLAGLRTPTLICQGERDPFGDRAAVAGLTLSPAIRLCWISDGDHGFTPRRSAGRTLDDNLDQAAAAIGFFIAGSA